jgi:hypothetical protein
MAEEERQRHIQALERRVAGLHRRLEEIGIVLRGSVVERWMPCGRKGCACQAVPPKLHGPYHQWTRKVDGKTKTVRLTKEEAAAYRQWIDNGRRLDAVIQEWEQIGIAAAQEIRAK